MGESDVYIAFGYCLFMLVLALLYKTYPPRKINQLYGYRTHRSMSNKAIWEAANDFSAHSFVKISLLSFVFPIASYFLYPTFMVLISIFGHLLLLGYSIFETEQFLNRNFDGNGNPK